jgi:hypothetical protein
VGLGSYMSRISLLLCESIGRVVVCRCCCECLCVCVHIAEWFGTQVQGVSRSFRVLDGFKCVYVCKLEV